MLNLEKIIQLTLDISELKEAYINSKEDLSTPELIISFHNAICAMRDCIEAYDFDKKDRYSK